jgi:hypothetical protein
VIDIRDVMNVLFHAFECARFVWGHEPSLSPTFVSMSIVDWISPLLAFYAMIGCVLNTAFAKMATRHCIYVVQQSSTPACTTLVQKEQLKGAEQEF